MRHTILGVIALVGFAAVSGPLLYSQAPASATATELADRAKRALAQHDGTLSINGLHESVEVIRDKWGVPHIYAKDTHDLFFAQGFTAAQDHMWQMELWRRNGEGKLSEVLGLRYLQRDKFARLLEFRGDWGLEYKKYHPDGQVIFAAFAEGVNEAIRVSLQANKVPLEFQLMGFQPEPVWTAKTVLSRMPGWTLSRNASTELARALAIKAEGIQQVEKTIVTEPLKNLEIPEGLDLDDINPHILDIAKGANDFMWKFKPLEILPAGGETALTQQSGTGSSTVSGGVEDDGAPGFQADSKFDLGSNNWVVGGWKSATGMPILANDPHREIENPALRSLVHLVAPGWNDIGATEPGMPGISIGHNEDVASGFTILGVDQQDLYVEETDPTNPNHYLYKGQWLPMKVDHETINVKGKFSDPEMFDVKTTIHGPVVYEDGVRHRAYSLKWVGAELGGAGYLGSLNVMQAKNWDEFTKGVSKSWYLPSHSLVYADIKGNYAYLAAALCPVRKNWDGLLPVPGKDGKYEWGGFVPLNKLPRELNGKKGYYASANNDVITKMFPKYQLSLGYEYRPSYRFDRINEVLLQDKKFDLAAMQNLQADHTSIPARELAPLFKMVKSDKPDVQTAIEALLKWDFVLDKDAITPTIYEYWLLKLTPLVYAPHLPPALRSSFRQYDVRKVIEWMKYPDKDFGANPRSARDQIMLKAMEQALSLLHLKFGDDQSKWTWGDIHTATFEHPLLAASTKSLLSVDPVRRGGDAYTVQATSDPTEKSADQESGASAMFVLDLQNWDRSVGLNTPGNESQAGSPHYSDLAPLWGDNKGFPLAFSRTMVEKIAKERLLLIPIK